MATRWIIPPMGLIEPSPAPEFYIDDCGAIEIVGDLVRLHMCSDQMPVESAGAEAQKIVVVKIVRPMQGLPRMMLQIAHCLWPDAMPTAMVRAKPHIVKD